MTALGILIGALIISDSLDRYIKAYRERTVAITRTGADK